MQTKVLGYVLAIVDCSTLSTILMSAMTYRLFLMQAAKLNRLVVRKRLASETAPVVSGMPSWKRSLIGNGRE